MINDDKKKNPPVLLKIKLANKRTEAAPQFGPLLELPLTLTK